MFITPTINSKGCYTSITPFDLIIQDRKPYTVIAIKTIKEIVLDGKDPFKSIYEPVGLTQLNFETDINEGVLIITLAGDGGEILDIPNRYLSSLPTQDGVLYSSKVLAVPLGIIPDALDLSTTISNLHDVLQDNLGVDASIEPVVTSSGIKISYADDAILTTLRTNNITVNKSWRARYLEEVARNLILEEKISKFECYIKNNCCGLTCGDVPELDGESVICQIMGLGTGTPEEMFIKKFKEECTGADGGRLTANAPPPDDQDFILDSYYEYSGTESCATNGVTSESLYLSNMMG